MNEARCIQRKIGQIIGQCRMASTGPNDVLSKMYVVMIGRINVFSYDVEYRAQYAKTFDR